MKTKYKPAFAVLRRGRQNLLAVALVGALAFGNGCATKNDAVAQAEKSDKNAPGIAETKAIAEQGFIYGLPLIMNYVANYQFWVDTNSSQYKCPMNQIFNESRVFTYKDTAVVTPNSDTPYSFCCLDLRAEPYVISVPAVEKERYYSVQLTDWNTFNYGYIGSRATGDDAGDYLITGPDWNGETPAGIKKVFHSTTQFTLAIFRTQLFGAGRHAERRENSVRLSRRAALDILAPTRAARRARPQFSASQRRHGEDEFLPVSRLRVAVRARRAGGKGDPRPTHPHRRRGRKDV